MSELPTAYAELVEGFRGFRNVGIKETLIKSGISKSRFLDSAEWPVNGPFCCARNDKVGLNQTFLKRYLPKASLFTTYGILVMSPP